MTIYRGHRGPTGTVVTADNSPLDPRLDLRNHAAVFEWGYSGSGPYQLGLALLADHLGPEQALRQYKDFTEACIAEIRDDEWTMDGEDIDRALESATPVPMDLKELLDRVRRGG